ncbi:hypothetical protein [Streptomyces decoyicus]|uniref:hypothetical protein n=1 Tax=Streptomyces decoyicus TaxID=249567 RepID=UPI0039A4336D
MSPDSQAATRTFTRVFRVRFGNLSLNSHSHSQVRVHTGIGRDFRADLYQDRRAYVWDNDGDCDPAP